ncbi:MAG: 50S ribosomal protein L16 [Planctomycetes bacterium]|nr:50S ribosomal protein L16 [Planctomycetota bacterium]
MALMPKRTKFRKQHRGRMKGLATRGNRVEFGEYGLMSMDYCWLTGRQLEAGRVAASRATNGEARIFIRVFPHKPISAKPAEVRMGSGKGEVEFWAAEIKPGTVLMELGGLTEDKARLAFKRVAHKLPIRVKLQRRLPTT